MWVVRLRYFPENLQVSYPVKVTGKTLFFHISISNKQLAHTSLPDDVPAHEGQDNHSDSAGTHDYPCLCGLANQPTYQHMDGVAQDKNGATGDEKQKNKFSHLPFLIFVL